jgi:hypothetical protein
MTLHSCHDPYTIGMFQNLLPKHECSLSIEHNPNRDEYQTVEEWVTERHKREGDRTGICYFIWESPEHRQRAIDTNELWVMRWYPDTPIGFNEIAAPTLQDLIAFATDFGEGPRMKESE